tara:strand:- start:138 stop:866 length:729 start_codon:yes stop_codon:yes gene_type:complete
MKKLPLMFADTETTGTEERDRLIQLAYRCGKRDVNELYQPPSGVSIGVGAMAVHHITETMVTDKARFKGSDEHKFLKKNRNKVVFVAHNAPFDTGMLAKEGIEFPHVIDTLRVIRHLDKDYKIERHNLQYLRYYFGMEIDAVAHDAWGDILVLEQLYNLLEKQVQKINDNALTDEEVVAKMIKATNKPVLMRKFTFGKHKERWLKDVVEDDRGYLTWLQNEKMKEPEGEEDWLYTLNYYLNK